MDLKTKARALLIHDEGIKLFPYYDPLDKNKINIGIGRNLTDKGISNDEEIYLFDDDYDDVIRDLDRNFPFYQGLSDNRKCVLINMCFNLGNDGLLNFKRMVDALENGDFTLASAEILNSIAAKQLPNRYQSLAKIMETDQWI